MLVKKYEAKDMQQAMDDIVKELGAGAVILNSRKIRRRGLFTKPLVEVMVAYEPPKQRDNQRKPVTVLRNAAHEAYRPYVHVPPPSADLAPQPNQPPQTDLAPQPNQSPQADLAPQPNQPPQADLAPQPNRIQQADLMPQPNQPPQADLAPQPNQPPPATAATQPHTNQVAQPADIEMPVAIKKIYDIDNRINTMDQVLSEFMARFAPIKNNSSFGFSPEVDKLVAAMCENQVDKELALALARETEELLTNTKDADPYKTVYQLVLDKLGDPAPIAANKHEQSVILFIGATGVGKTTTLVKLASDYVISQRKSVGIINTDTYRIAAHEQLRTYADILGIPLGLAYRMEEVEGALNEMNDRDLIFIDTAGKRPGDLQHQEDIRQLIVISKPAEIFLCIAATTCFSAIREILDTYAFTGAYKLIITKLDETRYHGMALNTVHYAKRPLAYISSGQNVPDDLETVNCKILAQQILEYI